MEEVSLEELDRFFEAVLTKLKKDSVSNISIEEDFYWHFAGNDRTNFKSPVDPVVGSLFDDVRSIKDNVLHREVTTYLDFDRLASILLYLSEKLNPVNSK
ncbi:MAG: hypothetical protein AAF655_14820 [Bacteroidota bacterium]